MFFSTSTPVPNTNTPYDPLINKVDSDIEAASNNENYGTLPALSFSTTGEATAWLLAVLGYIGTITAPAAVSASFYASLTVDATLSNSDSPYAKILWSLVKAAAVVPTILATNSAQTLFSRLVSRYQKDAMLGLMKEVVHPEMLLPLGIAIISAFSTAYVAECRNSTSGLFSDSIVDWFTYAAFISATITNTRLIRDILIKNIKASWIQDPQGLKKILRVILNDLSAEVSALENEINHKLIEKHITKGTSRKELNENLQLDEALLTPSEKKTLISSDTALEKLIKLHVLIKGQNNIQKLDFKLLTAWKNLSAKNQEDFFVEKSFCVKSGLWFAAIMAVIAAAIYTLPNFFSGEKAAEFSETLLFGLMMPGLAIASASFGVNTLINSFSLSVFFNVLANMGFSQAKEETKTESVCQRIASSTLVILKNPLSIITWERAQLAILSLYVFAQVGMVLVFPAVIEGVNPEVMKWLQLGLTLFVAPGLGKFSLEGAFNRLRAYHDAYQSGNVLKDGDLEALKELRAFNLPQSVLYFIRHGKMPSQDVINAQGGQGIVIHAMIAVIKNRLTELTAVHDAMDPNHLTGLYGSLEGWLTNLNMNQVSQNNDDVAKQNFVPCSPFQTSIEPSRANSVDASQRTSTVPVSRGIFLGAFRASAEHSRQGADQRYSLPNCCLKAAPK